MIVDRSIYRPNRQCWLHYINRVFLSVCGVLLFSFNFLYNIFLSFTFTKHRVFNGTI